MTNHPSRKSLLFAAVFLIAFTQLALAEKTTIKVQFPNRPPSYLRALERSGVLFVAAGDYALLFRLPVVVNASRLKTEVRLPRHRIKLTARNPFLVVTEDSDNSSSVIQLSNPIRFVDSLYYVPAIPFIRLLERLSPSGMSFHPESKVLTLGGPSPPPKYDITGLELESRLNGYLLTIKGTRKLGDYEAFLKQDGWLFVTIANAQADTSELKRYKPNGVVRQILTFQSPTAVQLTFRLSQDISRAEPLLEEGTNNLLIALRTKSEIEKEEIERKRQEQIREKLELDRSKQKLDVIVIDAGHGGKDPGTLGVTGTREKDVTLAVALKLGKLLEQNMKDVRIVYTRKTDEFIELYRRTKIANEVDGKLFVSIHCNSTDRKPSSANGFEIYLLRPGKTENAIRIAEKENKVIELEEGFKERYAELTEEHFILISMRQSAFVKHSESFAEVASEAMAKHLKIKNSGVKQAGFYVLVGASMPNVLVETGYLSNRMEEKVLRSKEGQTRIAEALFEGIREYKIAYERALEEGRMNGSRSN
ncbi:MAG TPA: hypothetical protein DCP63_04925 [Bacteroidetes bacterium]|nr:hypothetical protein [Bacteroidota bacterium]